MSEQEAALDKIDIASELKTLSPIEAKSLELRKQAQLIEIKDKDTFIAAKKIRKELVSHRTTTRGLRLTFTRKLDNLKAQFMDKEDEVLRAALSGEALVKEKIADWEKLEEDRKKAESDRINTIIGKIVIAAGVPVKATVDEVKRARARIKMELSLLDAKDKNKVAIKDIVATSRDTLDRFEEQAIERERLAKEAEAQRIERDKLNAELKQFEADMASAKAKLESVTVLPVDSSIESITINPSGAAIVEIAEEDHKAGDTFEKILAADTADAQDITIYALSQYDDTRDQTNIMQQVHEVGEISDGFHTFNELYRYRMLYNAAWFNLISRFQKQITLSGGHDFNIHKSIRHSDGELCFGGGWFIVMANLPNGQISNHYEMKDWDMFQVTTQDLADKWDGHTPAEAAERIEKFIKESK